MSDVISKISEKDMVVYNTILSTLKAWSFDKNYKFPELLKTIAEKLGVSGIADMADLDGQIRHLVKMHPQYVSKRGANGGVALVASEDKRKFGISARMAAKADAAVKVAAAINDQTSTEELEDGDISEFA